MGAPVNPSIDERLKDVEGDPQIANPKSLNEVEMEEWGELTKEGNFAFAWAWTLLKSEGRTRGKEQARRQFG